MTDDEFGRLCNTFGFAPSRALRELIDCVRAQEIEALERCKQVCAATSEGWRSDAEKWKHQHDALLEALRDATKTLEHLGYPLAAIERARAAIARAQENT